MPGNGDGDGPAGDTICIVDKVVMAERAPSRHAVLQQWRLLAQPGRIALEACLQSTLDADP
jgi:hypothetical protein